MLHRIPVTAGLGAGDLPETDHHGAEAVGVLVEGLVEHALAAPLGVSVSRGEDGVDGEDNVLEKRMECTECLEYTIFGKGLL